jgi:ATP-dependent DNA helicase RecG
MEKQNGGEFTSVLALKGVGPKVAELLDGRGIGTVGDLLYFLPVRYEDRRQIRPICEVREKEKAVVVGQVIASGSLFFRSSRKRAYEAVIDDGTGTLSVKWFQWNKQYLKRACAKGARLLLSGDVGKFGGRLQMVHPAITFLDEETDDEREKIIPVYPEIEGLRQGSLRNIMRNALEEFDACLESRIPLEFERSHGLITLREAFRCLHLPGDGDTLLSGSEAPGSENPGYPSGLSGLEAIIASCRCRLILEEYFSFQLALVMKRGEVKKERGTRFEVRGRQYNRFRKSLPFELTGAQERVIAGIEADMARGEPMNRLLQGDVGCGKTICALLAALIAIDNGYQVAFMAPTEILAEQHYLTLGRYVRDLGIPLAFLRGNMGKERKEILEGVKTGHYRIVIGTHALLQKDVSFEKLGLAVIDEQHRFGVLQRKILREKGFRGPVPRTSNLEPALTPHVLVMTATPIPRTLSMVIYGDLDVSVIDELPAGRQKIGTKVYLEADIPAVHTAIDSEVKKGRQVYIVYPLVEESDKMDLRSAKEMASYFQKSVFPSYRVELLHGRMSAEEKERAMFLFKNRSVDILVCTTVIEVGIDVPDATMIVIEHAERFGLSQLHQLRGRVGRGAAPSRCILVTASKRTEVATKRLKVMVESTDGFRIAEEDMKIRGPGDMLGVRQSGIPNFRIGDIVRDVDVMTQARRIAEEVFHGLDGEELGTFKSVIEQRWGSTLGLHDIA